MTRTKFKPNKLSKEENNIVSSKRKSRADVNKKSSDSDVQSDPRLDISISSYPKLKNFVEGLIDDYIPIIGIGSLLSEKSARATFPNLVNFHLAKLENYRRVFCHPPAVFCKHGISDLATKEIASLCAEKINENSFHSYHDLNIQEMIVTMFEIPREELPGFIEREAELDFDVVRVQDLVDDKVISHKGRGLLCTRSTDSEYIKKFGRTRFDENSKTMGLSSIWDNPGEIYPCRLYLRHCLLAAQKLSPEVYQNFLDTTYLYDRQTKLRDYLTNEKYETIMNEKPRKELENRCNG